MYVAGVNGALAKYPEFATGDIVKVCQEASKMPDDIKTAIRNHGAPSLPVPPSIGTVCCAFQHVCLAMAFCAASIGARICSIRKVNIWTLY